MVLAGASGGAGFSRGTESKEKAEEVTWGLEPAAETDGDGRNLEKTAAAGSGSPRRRRSGDREAARTGGGRTARLGDAHGGVAVLPRRLDAANRARRRRSARATAVLAGGGAARGAGWAAEQQQRAQGARAAVL